MTASPLEALKVYNFYLVALASLRDGWWGTKETYKTRLYYFPIKEFLLGKVYQRC